MSSEDVMEISTESKTSSHLDLIHEVSDALQTIVKSMRTDAGSDSTKHSTISKIEAHVENWVRLVKAIVESSGPSGTGQELRDAVKELGDWDQHSQEIDQLLDKLYSLL